LARIAQEDVATVSPNDDATAAWLALCSAEESKRVSGHRIADGDERRHSGRRPHRGRLSHDEAGVAQLRQAAAATALAHRAGMRATRHGIREAEVAAAMSPCCSRRE